MAGLLLEHPDNRAPQEVRLGGYVLHASFERTSGPSLADGGGPATAAAFPAGGLVVATAPDELLFAGIGVTVTFAVLDGGPTPNVGLQSVEEGRFENGKWQHVRWLNGDQTHQGRHMRLEPGRFAIQKVRLYRY
jgi:beta-galactosidase GanA